MRITWVSKEIMVVVQREMNERTNLFFCDFHDTVEEHRAHTRSAVFRDNIEVLKVEALA